METDSSSDWKRWISKKRRVFATTAVLVLVLVGLGPLLSDHAAAIRNESELTRAMASVAGGATPAAGSRTEPKPTTAGPSPNPPEGPSPPPGTVTGVYVPTPPVSSETPRTMVAPRLENLSTEYRYETVVGRYSFPKPSPYVVKHRTVNGTLLIAASTFAVIAPGVVPFASPQVLSATDYGYRVKYSLLKNSSSIGTVTITYTFYIDTPPKSTAELSQTSGSPLSLSWIALTTDSVAYNETATKEFGTLDPPVGMATPAHRLHVGPGLNQGSWMRKVTLDWSDAGNGSAFVGKIQVGGLSGAAVIVSFPAGMTKVDPVLVGTSSNSLPTD